MRVEFLSKFNRDLEVLHLKSVRKTILQVILHMDSANNLSALPKVKKLKGFKDACRIRVGDYRIGFFVEGSTILLARVLHRKDIYKLFP